MSYKLCPDCSRPFLWEGKCGYCIGLKDAQKEHKRFMAFLTGHKHIWAETRINKPCKVCGVFKNLWIAASEEGRDTN